MTTAPRVSIAGKLLRVALPAPSALLACHPGDLADRLAPLGIGPADTEAAGRAMIRAVELARRTGKGAPAPADPDDAALAELGAILRHLAVAVLQAGDPGVRADRAARILDAATPDEIAAVIEFGLTRFAAWLDEVQAAAVAVNRLTSVFHSAADAAA